jgi:hypothetical protein
MMCRTHRFTEPRIYTPAHYCCGRVIYTGLCPDCGELPSMTLQEAIEDYPRLVAAENAFYERRAHLTDEERADV